MVETAKPVRKLRILDALAEGGERRHDAWQNVVTGFGTWRDKTTFSRFVSFTPLTDEELSALYHGDAMAARIVDAVPDDMLREGFAVDLGDPKLNEWVAKKLQDLDARGKFADGERWGRCYGGAAILVGADDGRSASLPLIPERAKAVSYLYVIDRRYLWPATYYTEAGHPKLGEPETYWVSSPSTRTVSTMQAVHESRLVLFRGAPTGAQERQTLNSWDYSILQRPHEVLLQYNTGWKAVEVMLTDANQAVFKMNGLEAALAPGGEDLLRRRYAEMDRARSVIRAIVVDAGTREEPSEEFERQSVSFEQIPQTLEKLMLRLAGAADMPVTRLMGQSPAGMNATGESDTRNWYDKIRAQQNQELAPKIRQLVSIILKTKESPVSPERVERCVVRFPPLWTETPFQAAQTRQAIISGDAVAVQAGIWLPSEVALARSGPDGFAAEITLTEEATRARQAELNGELQGMVPDDSSTETPKIELAPTDIATALKVNEVRASQGFGHLLLEDGSKDPDGDLPMVEYKAKVEARLHQQAGGAPGGFPGIPAPPEPGPEPAPELAEPDDDVTDDEEPRADYDEDQPRDGEGKWTDGSSGGSSGGSDKSEERGGRREVARQRLEQAKSKRETARQRVADAKQAAETARADIGRGVVEQHERAKQQTKILTERLAQSKREAKEAEKLAAEIRKLRDVPDDVREELEKMFEAELFAKENERRGNEKAAAKQRERAELIRSAFGFTLNEKLQAGEEDVLRGAWTRKYESETLEYRLAEIKESVKELKAAERQFLRAETRPNREVIEAAVEAVQEAAIGLTNALDDAGDTGATDVQERFHGATERFLVAREEERRAERAVERSERTVRVHEREVSRLSENTPRADYDEDQPRDEYGRWTDEGGGSGSGSDDDDDSGTEAPYYPTDYTPEVQEQVESTLGAPHDEADIRNLIGDPPELPEDLRNPRAKHAGKFEVKVTNEGVEVYYFDPSSDPEYDFQIKRIYYRDKNDELVVNHALFTMPKEMQGRRVGAKILRNQVRQYDALGVARIELDAAWEGRYIWPSRGAEFKRPSDIEPLNDKFSKYLESKGIPRDEHPRFKRISELARWRSGSVSAKEWLMSDEAPKVIGGLWFDLQGESGDELRRYVGLK